MMNRIESPFRILKQCCLNQFHQPLITIVSRVPWAQGITMQEGAG
jgi:hypothetical protein